MSGVDGLVAQLVMRARQIERALHDEGPWSICVGTAKGTWVVPARKVVGENHVSFYAVAPLFDEQTIQHSSLIAAELCAGDDVVAVRFLESINGFAQVEWTFEIQSAEVLT